MKRSVCIAVAVAFAAVGLAAPGLAAQEKIFVGHGPAVELIDAGTLTTLASGQVGPGNTIGVAVSEDRRYGLVTEDSGGRIPTSPSLVVVDLTQPTLPIVARLAPGLAVRRTRIVPGGQIALAVANDASLTKATLLVIDMTATPPNVLTSITTGLVGDFDVTPDGKTAYLTGPATSTITIVDLAQSPPAPVGSIPTPTNTAAIRVSPDGARLVAMHQPNAFTTAMRAWDLANPRQPQSLGDAPVAAEASAVRPAFDPGNRFVVSVATTSLNPSFVMLFDAHAATPSNLYMLAAGAFVLQGLTVTRDGNRAFVAVTERHLPASIREVDLRNPNAPAFTNRVMLRFFAPYELVAFGALHADGPVTIGANHPVRLSVPTRGGASYAMAASFGTAPGIPVGGGRVVPLQPDALFAASRALPSVFQNFTGVLDGQGQAVATVRVPATPALRGLSFFVAAVVLDPSQPQGIGTVSNAERLRIR